MGKLENKHSALLTTEENELAFSLLGPERLALATTVVALYTTRGKDSDNWYYERAGVLCFVKDESKKSYFFVILSLVEKREIWEHEIYENMNYMAPKQFFHTFEAEDYIAAFKIVDEGEASFLYKTVIKELKNEKKRRNNNGKQGSIEKIITNIVDTISPKNKNKKRVLDKSDIGRPANFQHVFHIGWDAKLQTFLQRAGVSDNDLKDTDIWNFVLHFISDNGGMEMVAKAVDGTTNLPDYPLSPPPDRLSPKEIPNGPSQPQALQRVPPPPPLPFVPDDQMSTQDTLTNDPRSALRDAILNLSKQQRQQVNNHEPKDSRNNLLADIKKGVELKPVSEGNLSTKTTHAEEEMCPLAILKKILAERYKVSHSDQEESEEPEESATEDWN